jgi:multidrug efflux pump subunit AcrA (membrane-fusion protein)
MSEELMVLCGECGVKHRVHRCATGRMVKQEDEIARLQAQVADLTRERDEARSEAARLGGYLAVAESNRSPAVARALAAEAEVERLRGVVVWQTKNADNCRADASRVGQLWERAVKDWAAALAQVSTARDALGDVVSFFPAKDENWDRYTDLGPCPCYDGASGSECVCDEEARRIALKQSVRSARSALASLKETGT